MTLHYLIYKSGKLKIQNLTIPVVDINNDINYFVDNINSPENKKVNFVQKEEETKYTMECFFIILLIKNITK